MRNGSSLNESSGLPGVLITLFCKASIELHKDAITPGQKVLLHDDLLATGGTIMASAELIKLTGAELVGFTSLVELDFLNAREKLKKYSDNIITLANY